VSEGGAETIREEEKGNSLCYAASISFGGKRKSVPYGGKRKRVKTKGGEKEMAISTGIIGVSLEEGASGGKGMRLLKKRKRPYLPSW